MKIQVAVLLLCLAVYASAEDFKCETGVPYIENDCNGCFCNNGLLGCSYKACPSVKVEKCEVGTTFTKGCNKCWCTANYGTVCTNNPC